MMKLKVCLFSALLLATSSTTFADTSTSLSSQEEPTPPREHRSEERLRIVTQVVENPPRFVQRFYRQDGTLAKVAVTRLRTHTERKMAELADQWNRERSSGNLSGTPVVTLEDVVEEVIGEIRDPYDNEEADVLKQPDGSFIVDGSITIYDLEEETDINFPEERDYDTLAGFILETLTEIPTVGEHVEYKNIVFTVQTVQNNRIGKVQIQKDM